jgi:hypothetical protein
VGRSGLIAPGAFGDVVVSRVDPLVDIVGFADVDSSLSHVIQAGRGRRRTVSEFRSIIWSRCVLVPKRLESALDDAGMLTRPIQIDSSGGAELLRSTTSPDEYYVVGTWSSRAAYAAWHAISN